MANTNNYPVKNNMLPAQVLYEAATMMNSHGSNPGLGKSNQGGHRKQLLLIV